MNDAFQKFSEYKNNELKNRNIASIFNQNEVSSDFERFTNCLQDATAFIGELSFTKKHGKQRWLQLNS